MNIYRQKQIWKLALLIFAVIIGLGSLLYTNALVEDLKIEEREKAELLAEATRRIINDEEGQEDLEFLFSIIEKNNTVPVILVDNNGNIISSQNFDPNRSNDESYLANQLNKIREKSDPIIIDLGEGVKNFVYYKDSIILTRLIYYPYIQLAVIIMFISIAYFAFNMSRKAEQNQVWVGMSKETAHQLGTPTSSLAGWAELIKMDSPKSKIADELSRDVARLEKITERFSKIGSRPELKKENLLKIINSNLDYLRIRSSSKVDFEVIAKNFSNKEIPLNASLFEWVLENIFKNAIDAMQGEGRVRINISESSQVVNIDIDDTGKGIPKSASRNIFKPGYTTKERGWGLGLSLSKRIIETYHDGRIFVKYSEPGKGSCIRIVLKKT